MNHDFEEPNVPQWNGLEIILTKHALEKASQLNLTIHDVKIILEYGTKCNTNRKNDQIEYCTDWRGKPIKIVFTQSYSAWNKKVVWLIITIIGKR